MKQTSLTVLCFSSKPIIQDVKTLKSKKKKRDFLYLHSNVKHVSKLKTLEFL